MLTGVSQVMTWCAILLVKGYQFLISPLIGPHCRFYPSCSCYAITALKTRPIHNALWLILKRLLKCHPWHAGGVDELNAYPQQIKNTR